MMRQRKLSNEAMLGTLAGTDGKEEGWWRRSVNCYEEIGQAGDGGGGAARPLCSVIMSGGPLRILDWVW